MVRNITLGVLLVVSTIAVGYLAYHGATYWRDCITANDAKTCISEAF